MRFLILSSLLLFVVACATPKIQKQKLSATAPFSFNWDSTVFYKTSISVKGTNLSGIIIFNKENDSSIRLIMTTDVGPKLIDITLTPRGYTRNFVAKQLDRKALLHMFWEDFGVTLGLFSRNGGGYYNSDDHAYVYPLVKKFSAGYLPGSPQSFPQKAFFFDKDKMKTTISYFYAPGQQPDSISITHLGFDMNYILHKVK